MTLKRLRIALAILNRNEEEGLSAVLPRLRLDGVDRVFAVDGHSTDRSLEILRQHGIPVLPQPSLGRGEAFRSAFDHARQDVDAIIFFSPDGNENPDDVPRFRPLLEQGADVVIASRMMTGGVNEEDEELLRFRKWANLAFSEMARLTWGRARPKISDPINGFRAITVAAWDRLRPDGPGYTIEYQTSIRAYKLGLVVKEFATIEGQRIGGQSNARSIPTGLRFLRLFANELVRR